MKRLPAAVLLTLLSWTNPSWAATPQGPLTFDAASGLDTTRIRVVTSAPCPADTTNIVASATGKGLPAEGATIISNNDIDFSRTAPFAAPMSDTMAGFATTNGAVLSGAYVITLRCVDVSTTKTYAQFIGKVTFADAHHWTAPRAPDTLRRAVDRGIVAGRGTGLPGETPRPGAATPGASAGSTAAAGESGDVGPDGQTTSPGRGGNGTSPLVQLALAVAGTGLLVAGISSWRRERDKRKERLA